MQYEYFNPAFTVYLQILQCSESAINISFTKLQTVTVLFQILLLIKCKKAQRMALIIGFKPQNILQ